MRRMTLYQRIQMLLIVFIAFPLLATSIISYYTVKRVVTDKIHSSDLKVMQMIGNELTKTVEGYVQLSNYLLFDDNLQRNLNLLADVPVTRTFVHYEASTEIANFLSLATIKSAGFPLIVFFANRQGNLIQSTENTEMAAELKTQLPRLQALMAPVDRNFQWLGYLSDGAFGDGMDYYFGARFITNISSGKVLGTLYVGIPSSYFSALLRDVGPGHLELVDQADRIIFESGKEQESAATAITNETTVGNSGWAIRYETSKISLTGEITKQYTIFAGLIGISFFAFFLLSVLSARGLHRPIRHLKQVVERFGQGERDVRFPVQGADEIAILGTAFNRMLDRINQLILEVEQEQEEKRTVELQALYSQIRPHFLLNTLNSIKYGLALDGASERSKQIDSLMSLLRAYMTIHEWTTVDHECRLIGDYIRIMEMRSDKRYRLHVEAAEAHRQWKLPRLLLQPLVENAILHAFGGMTCDPSITIRTSESSDMRWMIVDDNGTGMTEDQLRQETARLHANQMQESGRQIGMLNVLRRLKLAFGNDSRLELERNDEGGLRVKLGIPNRHTAGGMELVPDNAGG